GLDTSFHYFVGTVSPFGNSMILIGRDKITEIDREYCTINLTSGNLMAGAMNIVSDVETRIDDIAFDPFFGTLFGYDSQNRHLVNLTTSGVVTSVGFQTLSGIASMGSLFFDHHGNLFAYGSTGGAETTLYLLDKRNGAIVAQKNPGPPGNFTDGCSCPFRLSFEKTVSPALVLPCGEVTYTYSILNTAGSAYTQVDLIDTLPSGFVITALDGVPAISQILSGVGSNVLHIHDLHVLLGTNKITVRARVGDVPPGIYGSQAVFGPFPEAFPSPFLSNDPTEPGNNDPTLVTVAEREAVLSDTTLVLCEGAALILEAAVAADTYLWSDGSTGNTLEVEVPGLYWVEASTACAAYRDTLEVLEQEEPLVVDLGADISIRLGDQFVPQYTTNATGTLQFSWSASGSTALNCPGCAHPASEPFENTVYRLRLTDGNGCEAVDSILVTVIPNLEVYTANAFSPNADGVNDVFYIQGKVAAPVLYLRIFDRWGALVFECRDGLVNDPGCGWNGKFKGKPMPEGVYVFVAEMALPGGFSQQLSGSVSLLR
ncbi:MAG: gliding motility-associated C-terminal domain-containing protein, partial [Saprospiraceae bacterium]|nr:gliding motility-associated C-terminal domain-containing protein [Saprospiraceae bacterium]